MYKEITVSLDIPNLVGKDVIRRFQPDLIHATSPGFLVLLSIIYSRIFNIPLVISYHTHLPVYAKKYVRFVPGIENLAWKIIQFWHKFADLTLVTSSQVQRELLRKGVSNVDVWQKGIDTERFHPKYFDEHMRTLMTNGNTDCFLMLYVGRLGLEKRLEDLKPILESMPNARLAIVGDGPQREHLEAFLSTTNRVHFTGKLYGEDLSRAFASADVFVMPSDSETLGFVVLESMASGVPVVAARAGGIPDLIQNNETSFLVETGNTSSFVDRLRLLQDNAFRINMGKKARREAERWNWSDATSRLRNIQYEQAIFNFESRQPILSTTISGLFPTN